MGLFTGSDPGGGPRPGSRPLWLGAGPKLSCFLPRNLPILEMLPGQRERSEGTVGLPGSGLRQGLRGMRPPGPGGHLSFSSFSSLPSVSAAQRISVSFRQLGET